MRPRNNEPEEQGPARRIDLRIVRSAVRKTLVQNLIAYAIAAAIVCYAARGVSWREVVDATSHATLWLFVVASLGGFLCWLIGETVLYSRFFSYFHGQTGEIEFLPTMAAVYFLQIVNPTSPVARSCCSFMHVSACRG